MDFTQIMQRYTHLREKYEQGEIDADSFEQQVNGMIYKDEEGRYWQIGVQTGLWYYYDGAKWVQDDLIDETEEEEIVEEPEIEMAAIDEIFPQDEPEAEPSPFDMAFEEQLASQFAEGGNSQIFDLFEDTDIFASILKGKGMDVDDPLAAPAEEVEGLAEHLETTQPVSIESLMGEGTAVAAEPDRDGLDFLFDENEDSDYPEIQEGSQMDLSAVLGGEFVNDNEVEQQHIPVTDVREVKEKDVVTGELHMPGEPLTKDALDALMGQASRVEFSQPDEDDDETLFVDPSGNRSPFEDDIKPALDWELETSDRTPVENSGFPSSPMLEILDDDYSLDDLVADSQQAYLDETQAVPVGTAGEFYTDPGDDDFFGSGEDAPFELPMQPDSRQMNTVPDEVSAPVGETMQSARPIRPKRKLPMWVILLIIFVVVFGVGMLILAGWNLISSFGKGEVPILSDLTNNSASIPQDDPNLLTYDGFNGDTKEDWSESNDFNTGVAGYHTGFYYLYSMAPEVPTTAVVDMSISDVIIDVEVTQLNSDHPETLSTYGVMCRVQDNGDGYAFRITNNGQYVIEKYQNGVFMPLNNWAYSEVIKANKDLNKNHVEVDCVGSQLTLTVNGHLLDVAVDGTFTTGKPGFVAQTGGTAAFTEVHYDELYLLMP